MAMAGFPHLVATSFLTDAMAARAIAAALQLGLIDRLASTAEMAMENVASAIGAPAVGAHALAELLDGYGVVRLRPSGVSLTERFREALEFREYLELRLRFADLVWPDIQALFPFLLCSIPEFMARSRVFDLFRYDRCLTVNAEALQSARRWTELTTGLTRYEAPAALGRVDLGGVGDFLDLGGNTGEFALQVCRRSATTRATVVDLPVVCELGREHMARTAAAEEADRIRFLTADLRTNWALPQADLVSFKSVLHDWPEADAIDLLRRGAGQVRPGGRIMIFERAPLDLCRHRFTYAMAPDLVFLHFLRPAAAYVDTLSALGFQSIETFTVELEVDFHLILATRPI